jgi:hypothetical protein
MGNPPFIGKQYRNAEQQADMQLVWGSVSGAGVLDYVTCWYQRAAAYVRETRTSVAFVSTNSITQGEQVGILWGELFSRYRVKIHFAHRTFSWSSESRGRAYVHVVILGFAPFNRQGKRIFDYESPTSEPTETPANNISPYLIEGSDLVVTKRTRPLGPVPELVFGSMPNDGGHLMLDDAERAALLAEEPQAAAFIRPLLGSEEFINGMTRWCLWLKDAPPNALREMPKVMERVEAVRRHRLASNRATTRELASTPTLFGEDRQPSRRYLIVPGVSSEQRQYIPMAFCEANVIANNLVYGLEGATDWILGVLTSAMHMSWVRTVAGRLESRYRYSAKLVYNNFPWPTPTPEQRARVEEKAHAVLAAREPHLPPRGTATLADLYDPNTMPRELLRAHTELDRSVERCYRPEPFRSDRERVEHLFRLYQELTAPLLPAAGRGRRRTRQDGQVR